MKLKSIKNIVIISGLLTLGICSTQELNANPGQQVEDIILNAFRHAKDHRSFDEIIDELIHHITTPTHFEHFKNMVQTKVSNPDGYIQEFVRMLHDLKKKTTAMGIVNELNKHKAMFDALAPNVMRSLLEVPLVTLNNLKTTLKKRK